MKRIALLGFAIALTAGVNAQDSALGKYDTSKEMTEQMKVIVNELGLEKEKVYELGQIMIQKQDQQTEILEQIDALKKRLDNVELTSEKMIQGMLTPEQWEKYQTELKGKIKAIHEKHMNSLED